MNVLDFHRWPLEKPMRRREFITFIGTALAAYPLTVDAQQMPMPVVAFIRDGSADASAKSRSVIAKN